MDVEIKKVQIINKKEDLALIEGDWRRLAKRFKNPLLDFDWFSTCAEAFNSITPISIFVIKNGNQIFAIAPMAQLVERGVRRLELLGTPFLGEPSGFLYSDETSLKTLINAIFKKKRPLSLRRLLPEAPETILIRKMSRKYSLSSLREGGGTPWLPITTDWDRYLEGLSSRQRYDLRRARKRAEEFGTVNLEIVSPKHEQLESQLEEIYSVEAAGWKGERGGAVLKRPLLKNFFTLFSRRATDQGILRLGFLRVDGKAIAVLLGLQYANRFWVLKIGYDENYSRCSPGILLLHQTIQYAFENRLEAYEFLGWDQEWMHRWGCQVRPHVSPLIYPFSIYGIAALALDGIQYAFNNINHARKND